VRFAEGTHVVEPPVSAFSGAAIVEAWRVRRPEGLVGTTVRIEGAATPITDILVRVQRLDGTTQVERLGVTNPMFEVTPTAGTGEVARTYLTLGFEHILGGLDHLLFVLSLLLVVRGRRDIFATITAFTVAHSLTLAAASLDVVRVPPAPVEAVIALSIVFVAHEAARRERGRPGSKAPAWTMAFAFGLLHGLGFAGALAEVGLPSSSVPLSLLTFNVGVELGQLAFVAVVLVGAAWVVRWERNIGGQMLRLAPIAIGGIATFWVIERTVAFWS
jgi:hydrogenase/urease accessory protein HupE